MWQRHPALSNQVLPWVGGWVHPRARPSVPSCGSEGGEGGEWKREAEQPCPPKSPPLPSLTNCKTGNNAHGAIYGLLHCSPSSPFIIPLETPLSLCVLRVKGQGGGVSGENRLAALCSSFYLGLLRSSSLDLFFLLLKKKHIGKREKLLDQ